MSNLYCVGDVFLLAGFHFVVTAINSENDIRCHLTDDYEHDLGDRAYYFKNEEPIAYYPEGLFISKRDYFSKVHSEFLDELCFSSRYLVPFKEFTFSQDYLDNEDDDGVWVIGRLKPEIIDKLLEQIPAVLEKAKDVVNEHGVKLIDGGDPIVDYATDRLDL